jgi:hypothetical protein
VLRAPEIVRQDGGPVALSGIDLHLREKESPREVCAVEARVAQIRTEQVDARQIGVPEIGGDEVSAAEVGTAQAT